MKIKDRKQKKESPKDYRLSITIPYEMHKYLAKLSEESLTLRSIASFVREALSDKYSKHLS